MPRFVHRQPVAEWENEFKNSSAPFTERGRGIGVLLTPSTGEHTGANVFLPAVVRQDE
jgi:hypothetical protein